MGRRRADVALVLASGLLAFLLYAPTLGFGFTNWDDDRYVIGNPGIQALTWINVKGWWTDFYSSNYAPLTLASLAADHALWNHRPGGFHFTNALLHALACALFALAMRRAGASPRASALGAAIFAAHPAQVESVAWVTERSAVLAMAFLLGAFVVWERSAREGPPSRGGYAAVLALYLAALLSKPTAAMLPAALFLHDLGRRREPWPRLLLEKWPFFAIALGFVILTRAAQLSHADMAQARQVGTFAAQVAQSAHAVGVYARILLFPTRLTTLHEGPAVPTFADPWALLGLALAGLGAARFVRGLRRRSDVLAWMGFFWIGLSQVLPALVHPVYLAERYLHVPLIGFAACAGIGADALVGRLSSRGRRVLCAGSLGAVIASLVSLTLAREPAWRDSLSLWEATIARPPARWTAYVNYGAALEEKGDVRAAIRQYEEAVRVFPRGVAPFVSLGNAQARLGELEAAEKTLRRAMGTRAPLASDRAHAARSFGRVLGLQGRNAESAAAFREALRAEPADAYSRLRLAQTLRATGQSQEARAHFEKVVARDPGNTEAAIGLAGLDAAAGRGTQARRRLDAVIAHATPSALPIALLERARLASKEERLEDARADLDRALALGPTGRLRADLESARASLDAGDPGRQRAFPGNRGPPRSRDPAGNLAPVRPAGPSH